MAFPSSRLSSLWTNIVKVSNNSGTIGASTTTIYMVRRNYTAVQWRNRQYVTTFTRTQQLLSVRKMIGQPPKLMSEYTKKPSTNFDADDCAPKKSDNAREEDSSFKVVNTDNSPIMGSTCEDSTKNTPTTASVYTKGAEDGGGGKVKTAAPSSGFCAGIAREEPKQSSRDGSKKFTPPEVKLPDRQQVEKYFFRSLAFIYDVAMAIMQWMRKMICRYIIMNDKVQAHWQNLRNKMEESKRN